MPWWSVPERDIPEYYDWHHQSPGFVFLRTNHKSSLTGVTYLDLGPHTEAEFLDEIQKKSLKSFHPFYSQRPLHLCLEISCLQTYTTSSTVSTVQLLCTAKEKGGKPDKKPYLLPYGFRNPYRNLKSDNSQDCAQKPQRNCSFMNSTLGGG
jgi:hypothetical protein